MSQITAKMVADLRAATGSGMMECKKALVEAEGDFEKAEEILRIKSGAKAGKLAGRIAAEGIITYVIDDRVASLVEVNCETDFVAKDEGFKQFANDVAKVIVSQEAVVDIDSLGISTTTSGQTVEEVRKNIIAKLGENISVRRFEKIDSKHNITAYLHGTKIGVLVEYEGDESVAKDVAMHIAASRPQFLSKEEVNQDVIEKERRIYTEQAAQSGKPAEIVAKIVEGRINKFLAEITLLGQPFVKNPDQILQQLLKEKNTQIFSFKVFQIGEGIEKKVVDYAAEVAAAAKV